MFKIDSKQLIQLGIYTVIYFFIYVLINSIAILTPILTPVAAYLSVIIAAIPFMLFLQRVKQFGLVWIMAILLGAISSLLGDYPMTLLTAIVMGGIADVICTYARRKKSTNLSIVGYAVFTLWQSGAYLPFLILRESVIADVEKNHGAVYAEQIGSFFTPTIILALFFGTIIAGFIGGKLAIKVIKKHFAHLNHV